MTDAPITPKFQDKAPLIMRKTLQRLPYLIDEDAAAVQGSFGVETGGYMLREESNGVGYGWAQWSNERRADFEAFCEANGYDPYSEDEVEYDQACFEFFMHEVTATWEKRVFEGPGDEIDGVLYKPVPECATLAEKVTAFMRLYERPGTPHEDWRQEMAVEALRQYRETDWAEPLPPPEEEHTVPYQRVVISSGHGKYVRGAHGVLDEVDEARRVVEEVAHMLDERGVDVTTYHDDVSTDQGENLDRIVDFHNSKTRELDISVHFNAYEQIEGPRGVEVLYVSQAALAAEMSAAIAAVGFIDRGAKKRTDLALLNNTEGPAILIEVCFVDSEADADLYTDQFDAVCAAIATVLGGAEEVPDRPARPVRPPAVAGRVDMEISGEVTVLVNGVKVWPV